jgi:ATP-dependent DNA helicase RecQ
LLNNLLEKDIDNIGLVRVTDAGMDFIENPRSITLTKDHNFDAEAQADEERAEEQQAAGHDEALFTQLKELRKQLRSRRICRPTSCFRTQA